MVKKPISWTPVLLALIPALKGQPIFLLIGLAMILIAEYMSGSLRDSSRRMGKGAPARAPKSRD